jgi:hypothetical protein
MDDYFSTPARRERALKFCYGYYCMSASDEDGDVQNGLSVLTDPRPLSLEEREEIVRLIERNPEIRKHYLYRFKEEGIRL